jgi:hypothetical protein
VAGKLKLKGAMAPTKGIKKCVMSWKCCLIRVASKKTHETRGELGGSPPWFLCDTHRKKKKDKKEKKDRGEADEEDFEDAPSAQAPKGWVMPHSATPELTSSRSQGQGRGVGKAPDEDWESAPKAHEGSYGECTDNLHGWSVLLRRRRWLTVRGRRTVRHRRASHDNHQQLLPPHPAESVSGVYMFTVYNLKTFFPVNQSFLPQRVIACPQESRDIAEAIKMSHKEKVRF